MAKQVKIGISQKLLLTLLVVALIPFVSIWFISYQSNSRLTEEKVNQELTAINNILTTHVDDWVDLNQRMLKQNASLAEMKSMHSRLQNPILESISRYYDWAYLVFTVDPKGNNIGRSDGKKTTYYGDRTYFKQVVDGDLFGEQLLIGKTSGKPAMVLATGIYESTGDLKGVLAQAMTLTDLSAKIVNNRIGKTGFTFLVDQKGEVIAHPDPELTRSRVDLSSHQALKALAQGQHTSMYVDDSGKKIVAVAKKTTQGWTMVTQQDYAEAYRLIKVENQKALYLLIATFVIVCLIAVLLSRKLTAPIRDLTEIADKYSQGQLDLKISGLNRGDEIGQLSQAIDRLGTSIRIAMNRLQKKKS
ncbi:methyl-accepting chemotaxis protein [Desulfuromusa kysingii]|uniref:histidine kinase n=1 Tax=Desulfuromusa kysingii TaxID=37625 RepID=A0A1H4BHL4_9BACT|nr:cache and HAMP domain-containing protein [Desulfuromusa kysingii]SEA47272.1 methyl-accepting chemotaxis protein [Desulfuromusa kysingii]